MKRIVALFTITLFLSSCSATMVPVMTKSIDAAGNIVTTTTPYITEASVAKSQAFYDMWTMRDAVTARMFTDSGVVMNFDDEGKIESVTIRGNMPTLAPLPQKVDEYPAWAVVENIGVAMMKTILIGYGIHEVAGMIGGMASGAGTVYHGDFNATQSMNNAKTSQAFNYSNAPVFGE